MTDGTDGASGTTLERLAPAVIERLPQLLEEVSSQLGKQWPDYANFIIEEREEVVVAARTFIQRLIRLAERDLSELSVAWDGGAEQPVFEEIGRVQWRQGHDLTSLLSAYQVGARAAWHHVAEVALSMGTAPDEFASLAEAVFVFIDQLSSASARGYVLEQSGAAAARERMRDELAELLLSDRSDSASVRAAAARVGWTLPREAAVVLIEQDNAVGRALLDRLDDSNLHIRRQGRLGAIVPDPAGPRRRERLTSALRGAEAVVGHSVSLDKLPASMGVAEIAATLRRSRVLVDDPVFVDEHLDAIIVHRDARLLEALRRQHLAPLADLSPSARERLCETLASWLRHLGDRRATAEELHIHPQTVRYRLTRLREKLGSALDDPASRQSMMLALAWGAPAGTNDNGPETPPRPRSHGRQ